VTDSQLTFRGGGPVNGRGVMEGKPRVYIVYWGSQWGTASQSTGDYTFTHDPQHMAPYQQNLFKGLGTLGETWSGVMTQYCDFVRKGSSSCPVSNTHHVGYPADGALAGVWYDNSSPAPAKASDGDIANEAVLAARHFEHTSAGSNLNNQYVITSPTGTNPGGCFSTPAGTRKGCKPSEIYCAWHLSTTSLPWSGDAVAYTNMPYIPDAKGQCGQGVVNQNKGTLDGVSIVGGHEYAETLTDPFPGGGWCGSGGCSQDENGDKCNFGENGAVAGDVMLLTGTFAMQPTWSNDAHGCKLSHPIVSDPGTPDASLDAMWNNYGDDASCATWSGGDATNSVALPNGQRAWFFSDTWLNSGAARKTLWDASLIHNSIVVSTGAGRPQTTITGGNTCQETNQLLPFSKRYAHTPAVPPDGGGYWTADQMVVGSNVIKFYYHVVAAGHSFTIDYPAVASIPVSSLEGASGTPKRTIATTRFSCGAANIIWGTALLRWNGSVYVYGWASTGTAASGIYLAKTSASGLANPSGWQLYEGQSLSGNPIWGTCGSGVLVPLPMGNTTTGFSVNSVNGELWLIQFDYTAGQASAKGWIAAHPSPVPWGFTNESVNLYYPPEGNHSYPFFYQVYEARLQPGLGPAGHVVISYNVNTTSVDTGCVSANAHDVNIYRPRFVDVPLSLFNPELANPSPAGSAVLATPAAAPAAPGVPAAGIDGATDWADMPLGSSCPLAIGAPKAPSALVQPDGQVRLAWPAVGTDVWYDIWFCDQSEHICSTEATKSPWIAAFGTDSTPLWVILPGSTIDPVALTSANGLTTSGHTFAIYIQSFGAQNSSAGGSSPEKILTVTVQPPRAPTGLTVSHSPGSSGNTVYTLSWTQVTYPSTAVYYTVLYCDATATHCSRSASATATWTALKPQLPTKAKLTFPTRHKLAFCVQAENLGGTSKCSNVVLEGG
jgi:hypothetical protein